MMTLRIAFFTLLLILTGVARAQDLPAALSAENVRDLKLVRTVAFADFAPFADDAAALPLSGWFTLSPDGATLAFVVKDGVRIVHSGADDAPAGGWLSPEATVIDARWDDTGERLAVVYQHADGYALSVTADGENTVLDVRGLKGGMPVRVWFDAESPRAIWIESVPAPEAADRSNFQVIRLDLDDPENATPFALPTGPELDFDSLVRIGRIPAPLAITATFEGTVRRWDLQTGAVTAEVMLPDTPTFGRVNETNGVEFAWRDEASTALHLLNFETGADRVIAPLHGEYIQALLLAPDASVVLAVHRGDAATVTAWIVETGEEIALGAYGAGICSRVPDMVQLARDGSRLVIGCDGGYEVWEIDAAP